MRRRRSRRYGHDGRYVLRITFAALLAIALLLLAFSTPTPAGPGEVQKAAAGGSTADMAAGAQGDIPYQSERCLPREEL